MSERTVVATDAAPAAIGPYSQAIVHGGLVYCSGQIGLDPASGALVAGGVTEQATRCLENLSAVLEAAGSSLSRALRVGVYVADMDDYAAVNEVYARFFGGAAPPSRSAIEAQRLPKDALVEFDCIAAR